MTQKVNQEKADVSGKSLNHYLEERTPGKNFDMGPLNSYFDGQIKPNGQRTIQRTKSSLAQNHLVANMSVNEKGATYEEQEASSLKPTASPFNPKFNNHPSSIVLPQRHVGNFNVQIT